MARETSLQIDLGGEQVELERVEAMEAFSTPFQVSVDIIATLGEVEILPHLGKPVLITLDQDGELQRYFHGLLVEGEFTRETSEGFHYRLQLRPWTHFLAHNRDYAIFQNLNAVQIIKEVLDDAGISDVEYNLQGTFTERDYCVQYGESDFAFISRLMEEEGIYYYFRHKDDRHIMVLVNTPQGHEEANPSTLTYDPATATAFNVDTAARSSSDQKFYVQSWTERVSSGGESKVTLREFDFTKPENVLEASKSADPTQHPRDAQEVYDYPGGCWYPGGSIRENDLPRASAMMLQALRSERRTYRGQSQSSGLTCGTKVQIAEHPTDRLNGTYLITETFHSITAERYRSGEGGGEEAFNVVFGAIPMATPFRPMELTPRPIVYGLESAIVTGPDGEEIYTDEYGRVKVRFHWDRAKTPGEKSTCWLRVSQTGGLGNIILPRVGHEVLVDFLGGDPDRPVVVGRVFNKSHMPVYGLPDNKTRAVWRTKRYGQTGSYGNAKSLDTGEPGANELRFEDKGGEEEVFLHAERDMNTRIRHMETHHVGHDQSVSIGYDRTETVGHDESVTVGNNRAVTIGADDELTVGRSIKVTAGTTIEIEAGTSITLKVGASTIKIDNTSIKLDAAIIQATATGTLEAKSPLTSVKGDGMLILKGGMTMIN